jgi:hypothetical protein
MKVKTLDAISGSISGVGSVAGGSRRAEIGLYGLGFGRAAVDRRVAARFRPRSVGAGAGGVSGAAVKGLGCGWARVEDVSKRRCQGLVVCRATLPVEGLDARPAVTLAPTSLDPAGLVLGGRAARQSATIRV